MGATVHFLPALGMPSHILYCPKPLIIPGLMVAFVVGVAFSLIFEGMLILGFMLSYAAWHGFWFVQYRRDPWIVMYLRTRYKLGLWGNAYTKTLIKEKAWVYGA